MFVGSISLRLKVALVSITSISLGCLVTYAVLLIRKKKANKEIRIISSGEEWETIYPQLVSHCQDFRAVGLDCEWVTRGIRRPVALMQIATKKLCIIVQMRKIDDPFPNSLKEFLKDRSILKIGVSILDDAQKLCNDYGLVVKGCVDLRNLLKQMGDIYICKSQGLKGLAKGVLGINLPKDQSLQCSDWEADYLSESQVNYAAKDAMIGLAIFDCMVKTKINKKRIPHYLVDQYLISKPLKSICQGLIDIPYKGKREHQHSKNLGRKAKKEKDVLRAYSLRKKPLYDNTSLLAPDGQMLCICDERKALWYLEKGLGEMVSEDPLVIQLNFEPSGRPASGSSYYLQEKQNVCVVCGKEDGYIRKNIIPHDYKRYFPPVMKDHSSHDVLLLCTQCHQLSSQGDNSLRQQLAKECDAPLDSGSDARSKIDPYLSKLKSTAKALKLNGSKIPEWRKVELETFLKKQLGVPTLTDEILTRTLEMDARITHPDHVPHGKKVVDHMHRCRQLLQFQQRWRIHFLETMQPKFLPLMWSVDHNIEKLTPVVY